MEYEFVTDTREIQFPHFTIRIEEDNHPPEVDVDPPGRLDRRCFLIWKEELVRVTNVREIGVRVGVSLVSQDLRTDLEMTAELLSALGGIFTSPLDESDRKSLQRDGFETSRLVTHNAGGMLTSYFIDWGNDQKLLFHTEVFLDRLTSETTLVANLYAASMLLLPNSSPLSWAQVAEAERVRVARAEVDDRTRVERQRAERFGRAAQAVGEGESSPIEGDEGAVIHPDRRSRR